MSKLAINGGTPVRTKLFPAQNTTTIQEAREASRIIEYGILSAFRGNYTPSFYGGTEIRRLETFFALQQNFAFATAVNSCTSALQIACGAIGLQPGDEVIVTPWSMSCSATAPMIWGATPVFADIEPDFFCLDPKSVKEKITKRTKAIIAVDLFGQPIDYGLKKLAEEHGLFLIEDAAQAIGAWYHPKAIKEKIFAGGIGHIGCFSFTQGKHLTAGEGGMITVKSIGDKHLNRKCQLIRNHAEAVINSMKYDTCSEEIKYEPDASVLLGFNMRMTEVQAAILNVQIHKLEQYVSMRQHNVQKINMLLMEIPGILPVATRKFCDHVYYVQAFHYDKEKMKGVHRDIFIQAVKAELAGEEKRLDKGVPIGCGYIRPLYMMPLFHAGKHWALANNDYAQIKLPVVERLWKEELFTSMYHGLPLISEDFISIHDAFIKVYNNIEELL